MTYKKKLIEVALPLEAINKEAAREKSIRHGHPSTLHLWWARRPLAACRAVLFASLVDDPSECVAELMKDSAKRKAAEKELRGRKKLWDEMTAVLEKARAGGISAPPPGPEPKLEDMIAEIERERLFNIIRELVKWENSDNPRVLNAARAEIMRSCNGNPPPVCDPFCGGGSIPLEAQRLGLEAHASDLNPVPVLINKALIEIPPKFSNKPPVNPEARKKLGASGSWKGTAGLAEDIRYYGQWVRKEALKRVGKFYQEVAVVSEKEGQFRYAKPEEIQNSKKKVETLTVIAWLWARTVESPNPAFMGCQVPLVSSFWLSTKPGKETWVEPVIDGKTYKFEIRKGEPRDPDWLSRGTRAGKAQDFLCLLSKSPLPREYVREQGKAGRLGARLMAVVAEGSRGRVYLPPTPEAEMIAQSADSIPGVAEARTTFLSGTTPTRAMITGGVCSAYGLSTWGHLFTSRQLVGLTTLSTLITEVRKQVIDDYELAIAQNGREQTNSPTAGLNEGGNGAKAYAESISVYLSFALSRSADRGSCICSWDSSPKMEALRNTFGRQALPMVWDFAEGNPFSDSSGSWNNNVEFTAKSVEKFAGSNLGFAKQADATEKATFIKGSLFSTDPPYYDNISYAELSDFFYVWLRQTLRAVYPNLFETLLVPKATELVATPFRHGSQELAEKFFLDGMSNAIHNMAEATPPAFPVTIYYAFKQAERDDEGSASTGWETFLEAVLRAGFSLTGTWPMRTELSNRMVSVGTNALASSVVLVCRARMADAGVTSRRDFLAALKKELPEALRHLQKGNIAPVDLAQAAIGPGMAVFSRYAKVLETDGSTMSVRSALTEINRGLDEVLAEQEGEFDADTRWALAWFDQYGFNEGAYGSAETLSTAKNTSVSGMAEAGILTAKGGKVRLLKKEELDADWNPATDKRLTIWEITHHLIRRLQQGESGAAELIHQLGAKAEVARDLSYRLYTICERRKWAQEAIAYNALVLSWSDVQRLAQEKKAAATPTQGEMQL